MVALEKLAKICAQNPASILFARLADGLLQQGDVARALAVCRTGLRYRPSYVAGHVVMGKCYLAAGQCKEARLEFEKVLQLDADHLVARWHLGHIALQQGRGDLALKHFELARARDPFGPELSEQIGKLKGEEARDETSESKALSAEPDAPGPASEDAGFSQVSDLPSLSPERRDWGPSGRAGSVAQPRAETRRADESQPQRWPNSTPVRGSFKRPSLFWNRWLHATQTTSR